MSLQLDTPIQYIKGVGPQRAKMLEKAGIRTAEDLLNYRPFRYEDRTSFCQIFQLKPDQEAVIYGTVAVAGGYATPKKGFRIFELVVRDESGTIPVKFFNQSYLSRVFEKGQQVVIFGAPKFDFYTGGLCFQNPEFEILGEGSDRSIHIGRIVPVYRKVGKLTTRVLRQVIYHLIEALAADVTDPLPEELRLRWKFPSKSDALASIHFPEAPARGSREKFLAQLAACSTPAHQRMIFEEFFQFQLGLLARRAGREIVVKGHRIMVNEKIRSRLKKILPFRPTNAQKRVLKEIVQDLQGQAVMARLLQGDVGSGKTIVALLAIAVVIENGFQAALMAPTELLAEQHYRNTRRYFEGLPYRVGFLSGSIKGKARKEILGQLERGEIDLVVGTHSLIQDDVRYRNLAFAVIDEQHRFGVLQRSKLMEKGEMPDTLVMTATPIPRSLALTVYGDLSVSVMDELPPGRKPVRTVIKTEKSREEVYSVLRRLVAEGGQVYIVYPLVEESEKIDLKAASEMAEHLGQSVFPEYRVGLMHGRLKAEEKDELMRRFSAGEVQLLVSTTVIEVGIDVPNANTMVIEHAERFGLSQLHQLRGRVGRGDDPGLCILMVDRVSTPEAYERIDIMRKTSDGFKIAEKDLEIRGPGEFVGTRQSGVPEFLFGNIVRDRKLLELARQEAGRYLGSLGAGDSREVRDKIGRIIEAWKDRYGLYEVG